MKDTNMVEHDRCTPNQASCSEQWLESGFQASAEIRDPMKKTRKCQKPQECKDDNKGNQSYKQKRKTSHTHVMVSKKLKHSGTRTWQTEIMPASYAAKCNIDVRRHLYKIILSLFQGRELTISFSLSLSLHAHSRSRTPIRVLKINVTLMESQEEKNQYFISFFSFFLSSLLFLLFTYFNFFRHPLPLLHCCPPWSSRWNSENQSYTCGQRKQFF